MASLPENEAAARQREGSSSHGSPYPWDEQARLPESWATLGWDVEEPQASLETVEDPSEGRVRRVCRTALEWSLIMLGALLVALLVKTFLFQAFYIPSESMLPTLKIKDRVIVNKLSYRLHDINRGDLIVFTPPPSQPDPTIKDLIKRVIALPGETIEARDGKVFVNGRPLAEPWLPAGTVTNNLPSQQVPPGRLWVMGDNRGNSSDSRVFKTIDVDTVVGRAFIRVWPLSELGFL